MLSVENISVHYGSRNVLKNVTQHFESGLFHVILGPNGSGKSTFLKVFSGELKPAAGKILYDGKPITTLSTTELARRRAVMSQSPELPFPLSVREIVMMGRYPHFQYKPSKNDVDICVAAMRALSIEDMGERDYLTLSGGEKQRVQFARVLTQIWERVGSETCYLLLDEPVSSLDIHYQQEFLRKAKSLCGPNLVLIAVLHDINLAFQYADRVYLMSDGAIKFAGVPQTVISEKVVEEIFNVKVRIMQIDGLTYPVLAHVDLQT